MISVRSRLDGAFQVAFGFEVGPLVKMDFTQQA